LVHSVYQTCTDPHLSFNKLLLLLLLTVTSVQRRLEKSHTAVSPSHTLHCSQPSSLLAVTNSLVRCRRWTGTRLEVCYDGPAHALLNSFASSGGSGLQSNTCIGLSSVCTQKGSQSVQPFLHSLHTCTIHRHTVTQITRRV